MRDLTVHHLADTIDNGRVVAANLQQMDRVSQRCQRVPQLMSQHAKELVLLIGGPANLLEQLGILLLGPSPLGDIPSNFRCPDDFPAGVADRRDRKRDIDDPSVLGLPDGFVMLDALSLGKLLENPRHVVRLTRDEEFVDRLPEHLVGGIAEYSFSREIPARDDSVERLGHDCIT